MSRTFVPNPRFETELLASPEVRDLLDTFKDDLETIAKSRVRKRTGNLERSIHYDVDVDGGQFKGRLNADDFKAGWYEFGSARTDAESFLRSSVEDVVGPVTGDGLI